MPAGSAVSSSFYPPLLRGGFGAGSREVAVDTGRIITDLAKRLQDDFGYLTTIGWVGVPDIIGTKGRWVYGFIVEPDWRCGMRRIRPILPMVHGVVLVYVAPMRVPDAEYACRRMGCGAIHYNPTNNSYNWVVKVRVCQSAGDPGMHCRTAFCLWLFLEENRPWRSENE